MALHPDFLWLDYASSLQSSYKKNRLGWMLYSLVRVYRPEVCVEIGLLEGYSAIFTLAALRDNDFGRWYGYDLFEDYPYRHRTAKLVIENIAGAGVDQRVESVIKADFSEVPALVDKVDFIHIDISNTGQTYLAAAKIFYDKMNPGGFMALEGGSPERDRVEWMVKYNKPSINSAAAEIVKGGAWDLFMYVDKFPSLTVFRKRL